jgi:hypothetical protein
MQMTHWFRPAGKTDWILIDQQSFRTDNGKVLEYRKYKGTGTDTLLNSTCVYSCQMIYTSGGKLTSSVNTWFSDKLPRSCEVARYYYSGERLDSSRYETYSYENNRKAQHASMLYVYHYKEGYNVPRRLVITSYDRKRIRRKYRWVKEADSFISYSWR